MDDMALTQLRKRGNCMKTRIWIAALLLCVVTFSVSSAEILSEEEKSIVIAEYTRVFDEHASEWTQFAETMLSDQSLLSPPQHFRSDSSAVIEAMKVFDDGETDLSRWLSSCFDYIVVSKESGFVLLVKELGIYHIEGIPQMYLLGMHYELNEIHPDNMKFVVYADEENRYHWSIYLMNY